VNIVLITTKGALEENERIKKEELSHEFKILI
jgi:hypothetical protein